MQVISCTHVFRFYPIQFLFDDSLRSHVFRVVLDILQVRSHSCLDVGNKGETISCFTYSFNNTLHSLFLSFFLISSNARAICLTKIKGTYVFHSLDVVLDLFVLLRLFRTVFVDFFEPFANIFLVLLTTLVKIDTRLIVSDPTLAEVAKFTTLRLPVVRPGITI